MGGPSVFSIPAKEGNDIRYPKRFIRMYRFNLMYKSLFSKNKLILYVICANLYTYNVMYSYIIVRILYSYKNNEFTIWHRHLRVILSRKI